MLYMREKTHGPGRIEHQWHVGEPVPAVRSAVVEIQADGDELDMILRAMRGFQVHDPKAQWMSFAPNPEVRSLRLEVTDMISLRRLGEWLYPLPPEAQRAIEDNSSKGWPSGVVLQLRMDSAVQGPEPVEIPPPSTPEKT